MYLLLSLFNSCNPFEAKVTLFNSKSIFSKNGIFGKFELTLDGNELDAAYPLSSSKYTFVTSDVILSNFNGTLILFALFNYFLILYFLFTSYQEPEFKSSTVICKLLLIIDT